MCARTVTTAPTDVNVEAIRTARADITASPPSSTPPLAESKSEMGYDMIVAESETASGMNMGSACCVTGSGRGTIGSAVASHSASASR